MDVVLLSRLQFALTIMFHYLFPPLTIGLGAVLVFLEHLFQKTQIKGLYCHVAIPSCMVCVASCCTEFSLAVHPRPGTPWTIPRWSAP